LLVEEEFGKVVFVRYLHKIPRLCINTKGVEVFERYVLVYLQHGAKVMI
jgi:hypothetical protein